MKNRSVQTTVHQCPIETTIELIGGKWKVIILYHLLTDGVLRFSELKRNAPGVTQKMLTSQLRELEAVGLLTRKVYPIVPPKVEYTITPLGTSLGPILEAMKGWGQQLQVSKTAKGSTHKNFET